MKPLRVAAYCRVSTEREGQQASLRSQQEFFRQLIARTPGWCEAGLYCDEGASGTSLQHRPAFQALLAQARAGQVDLIVTKEVSRFARNTVDALALTRELAARGVGVLFLSDGIHTLQADGELRLALMATLAQEESRKTSARVKWGQRRRMEAGVVFGSAPFGFRLQGGQLVPDPAQARTVCEIFQRYVLQKQGVRAIAQALQQQGVPTSRGGSWRGQTVLRILQNEKYAGQLVQKKTVTVDYLTHRRLPNSGQEEKVCLSGHHPPLVDPALWQAAQRQLQGRRARATRGSRPSARCWCSGLVRCGLCGAALVRRSKKRADGTVYYSWRCSHALQGRCTAAAVGAPVLERCAWAALQAALPAGVEGLALPPLQRALAAPPAPPPAAPAGVEGSLRRLLAGRLPPGELEALCRRLQPPACQPPPTPQAQQVLQRARALCALAEGEAILQEAVTALTAWPDAVEVALAGQPGSWRVPYQGRGSTARPLPPRWQPQASFAPPGRY